MPEDAPVIKTSLRAIFFPEIGVSVDKVSGFSDFVSYYDYYYDCFPVGDNRHRSRPHPNAAFGDVEKRRGNSCLAGFAGLRQDCPKRRLS
jgi:hypothetical protein